MLTSPRSSALTARSACVCLCIFAVTVLLAFGCEGREKSAETLTSPTAITQTFSCEGSLNGHSLRVEAEGDTAKLSFRKQAWDRQSKQATFKDVTIELPYDAKSKRWTLLKFKENGPDIDEIYYSVARLDSGHAVVHAGTWTMCEAQKPMPLDKGARDVLHAKLNEMMKGSWVESHHVMNQLTFNDGSVKYKGNDGERKGSYRIIAAEENFAWLELVESGGDKWPGYVNFREDDEVLMGVFAKGGTFTFRTRRPGAVSAPAKKSGEVNP